MQFQNYVHIATIALAATAAVWIALDPYGFETFCGLPHAIEQMGVF